MNSLISTICTLSLWSSLLVAPQTEVKNNIHSILTDVLSVNDWLKNLYEEKYLNSIRYLLYRERDYVEYLIHAWDTISLLLKKESWTLPIMQ